MKYRDFKKYCANVNKLEELRASALWNMEDETGIDIAYLDKYDELLQSRLSYSRFCFEYFSELHRNSFWFMKPRVGKFVREAALLHSETLSRLIAVRTYKKLLTNK